VAERFYQGWFSTIDLYFTKQTIRGNKMTATFIYRHFVVIALGAAFIAIMAA